MRGLAQRIPEYTVLILIQTIDKQSINGFFFRN